MSSGAVSADDYPIRELREYIAGKLDVEHQHASPAALIEDDRARRCAEFMESTWEPPRWPDDHENDGIVDGFHEDFWKTDYGRRLLKHHANKKIARILREGDKTGAAGVTGLPNYESDASNMHTINKLADWLIDPNQITGVYMAGQQGAGKTDFSLLLLEIINRYFERGAKVDGVDESSVARPEFAANFKVDAPGDMEVELINTYSGLTGWLEGGDSDDEKIFVFDEASTELTAQSGENSEMVVDRLNSLWKRGRKKGLSTFLCIGHDKKDIHPLFRNLCDFVHKTDTKTAEFYASVSDREGEGKLFEVSGIPETSLEYDTDDMATWTWDDDTDEELSGAERADLRDERIARLYDKVESLTQDQLADAFNVSRSTVSRAVNDDD